MLLGTTDSFPEIDKNKRLIPSVNKKTSNIIARYRRSFFGSVVSIFQADVNTYLQCVFKIAFLARLAIRARSEQARQKGSECEGQNRAAMMSERILVVIFLVSSTLCRCFTMFPGLLPTNAVVPIGNALLVYDPDQIHNYLAGAQLCKN